MIEKRLSEACLKMWTQIYWIWGIVVLAGAQSLWLADEILPAIIIIPILLIIFILGLIYMRAFWKCYHFTYDDEELRVYSGVFWRKQRLIPFSRITNVNVSQGPWQRMVKVATLSIETAGQSGTSTPESQLLDQLDYENLREDLLKRVSKVSRTVDDGTGESDVPAGIPPWREMVDLLKQIESNTRRE